MSTATMHRSFVEKTLAAILRAMERASSAETIASRRGIMQAVDARVKLAGCVALIIAAAVSRNLATLAVLFGAVVALAFLSRVSAGALGRAWAIVFAFTAAMALPALFTTPGDTAATVADLRVTIQGLRTAAFLVTRVETAATLGLLLVATTPWPHVIAALRSMRVPAAVVLIIAMTYRYVFVLLETAEDMFMARRSRSIGETGAAERRRIATSAAGVLLGKSLALADDVYLAMRSRGFRGDVYLLDEFEMRRHDWIAAALFTAATATALWLGLR